MMRTPPWSTLIVILSIATSAAADPALPVEWRPVSTTRAPATLEGVVPDGAYLAPLFGGDVVRIHGAEPPRLGRLWRNGTAVAYLDEGTPPTRDRDGAWRWTVPLGGHEAAVIAVGNAPPNVERAALRDPGYAWEAHEDALAAWTREEPPLPPSIVAMGAWRDAAAVAALYREAAVSPGARRDLAIAVALDGVAAARPFVGPYYRVDGTPLPLRRVERRAAFSIAGPRWIVVRARGPGARVEIRVDDVAIAGGLLPLGPRDRPERASWIVRVPSGIHRVAISIDGSAAEVEATSFRKREHLHDAITDEESIEARARTASSDAPRDPLVIGEARRLLGDRRGAATAFAPLVSSVSPPARRVLAAWRLGEIAEDPDEADRYFVYADSQTKALAPRTRDLVRPALARARALRAIRDGRPATAAATVRAHPSIWIDPELAPVVAGGAADEGDGPAHLAAVARAAGATAGHAVRRAWYDRTRWIAAQEALGADATPVLTLGGCAEDPPTGDALVAIGARAVAIEIPADPLGADRFRIVRVLVATGGEPALGAAMIVDGFALPLPSIQPLEEHRVALAPGRRSLRATGGARLFLAPPGGIPRGACGLWRRRAYAEVDARGRAFPVAAPAGSVIGLELRGRSGAIVAATIHADGRTRALRYRAAVDGGSIVAARPGGRVAGAVVVDLEVDDLATLRVATLERGGPLLVRPLVRAARGAEVASASTAIDRAASIAAASPDVPTSATERDPIDAIRRLGLRLAETAALDERARLHVARAVALARLGRHAYADEDLRSAAALEPENATWARLIDAQADYVPAVAHAPGYPIDPLAVSLATLARDPNARAWARRVRDGDARAVRNELRRARSAGGAISDGALALAARLDASAGDPAGAAAACALLAERRPELPRLRVAQAAFHLDDAAREAGPGILASPATRAFVAALLAGEEPGAADALARAADATRWRAVLHAESAAGSRNGGTAVPIDADVRAALAAPAARETEVAWIEPGLVARAVFDLRDEMAAAVHARCVELRPHAAARRGAPPACRLSLRLDGQEHGVVSDGAVSLSLLPGRHAIEVVLAPGGVDAVAAVRFAVGDAPLRPRIDGTRWLADPEEPVVIAARGPTAVRLQLGVEESRETLVDILDGKRVLRRVRVPMDAGVETLVPLVDERPYQLTIRPANGRIAVAAQVREDRRRPAARIVPVAATDVAPVPPPGSPPRAHSVSLRFTSRDAPGTITAWGGVRDGAVGERDTATDLGGRYAAAGVSYRRRTGDVWWRVDGFGRARAAGDPSGGFGARVYWRGAPLRLEAGAFGILQALDAGTFGAAWADAAAHLRLDLDRDRWLTTTFGGFRRVGPRTAPDDESVDPDVWSRFDAEHTQGAFAAVRADWTPFLDLATHARLRAVTNADLASIDRAGVRLGATGAIARLAWGASVELERRFADDDRERARFRTTLRLDASWGIWRAGDRRLAFVLSGAARPDERSDLFFGVSYDWTFGRGLADYAPPDSSFAAQLGPWNLEGAP